jgi:hypothetical protein
VIGLQGERYRGQWFGFDVGKQRFIAKAREFLEHLGSYEFDGREEYAEEIERALQELERSTTSERSERIMNEICLKVTIACYALKAYERSQRSEESESGGP